MLHVQSQHFPSDLVAMARLSEEQYRSFGTQILPELFLTSSYEAKDAAWLKKHGITPLGCRWADGRWVQRFDPGDTWYNMQILGLRHGQECPPSSALQLKSLHIPLRDSPRTDVASHFEEVFDFIDAGRNSKSGAVLVHCFEGKNRSAAFVIGYLMQKEKCNLHQALCRVKSVRSFVEMNIGFHKQLLDLERSLSFSSPSVPLDAEACHDLLEMDLITSDEINKYKNNDEISVKKCTFL
eukprot:s39_g33.t1